MKQSTNASLGNLCRATTPVKVVAEHIDAGYRHYLEELREKNRQRILLQKKSRESIRRHRLEDGFKLYFNVPASVPTSGTRRNQTAREKGISSRGDKRSSDVWISPSPANIQKSSRATSAPNLRRRVQPRKAWMQNIPFENDLSPSQKEPPSCEQEASKLSYTPDSINLLQHNATTLNGKHDDDIQHRSEVSPSLVSQTTSTQLKPIESIHIQLDIIENWGDPDIVGLNALNLLLNGEEFCSSSTVTATCTTLHNSDVRDAVHLQDHLQRLLVGPRPSTVLCDAWIAKANCMPLTLQLSFSRSANSPVDITIPQSLEFHIWNFNVPTMLEAGVKRCELSIKINESFVVKKHRLDVKIADGKLSDDNVLEFCISLSPGSEGQWVATHTNSGSIHSDKNESTSELPKSEGASGNFVKPSGGSLLDKVSEDLLNSRTDGSRKGTNRKALRKVESMLEESWSSLDFFNHFHAGRLFSGHESSRKPFSAAHRQLSDDTSVATVTPISANGSTDVPVMKVSQLGVLNAGLCVSDGQVSPFLPETEMKTTIFCPHRPSNGNICIPELPSGRRLVIDIVNTWGDIYYVGLSGIEIFTANGTNISPSCSICADPADINVLPEYGQDPRVVANLLDGVNLTRDDVHMWLTPFTAGERHLIQITLPLWAKPIAMVRIWNYNKSRVHTSRGVREIIIYLDGEPIFHGEIRRATGLEPGSPEDCSETILFTTDDHILELIAENDEALKVHMNALEDVPDKLCDVEMRPVSVVSQTDVHTETPSTDHNSIYSAMKDLSITSSLLEHEIRFIDVLLLEPWDQNATKIGLTGFEILDEKLQPIEVKEILVLKQYAVLETLDTRLLDKENETIDRDHMWCYEYDRKSVISLRIPLPFPKPIRGIRLWNYNNRQTDRCSGVKVIKLVDDHGHVLGKTDSSDLLMLRRAPGHTDYPFAQLITWKSTLIREQLCDNHPSLTQDESQNSALPVGFVYQLQIFSAWHDNYYVGLNGLEPLGPTGKPVSKEAFRIYSSPKSIDELQPMAQRNPDIRTADKLVDGVNWGPDIARHCWLVPILPRKSPCVFLVFDEPVKLSGLRLWNYTRTPDRGVCEFSVLIDEQVVFRSYLPKATANTSHLTRKERRGTVKGILPNCELENNAQQHYTVAFDKETVKRLGENPKYILGDEYNWTVGSGDFSCKLINVDRPVNLTSTLCSWVSPANLRPVNPTLRPFTCVSHPTQPPTA